MNLQQENIMGYMPVGHLIFRMSFPMMLSMLVQSLYNIVDSIFVARIAEDALTAVTLAMPLQSIMTAITVGLSAGVNAVVSKHLGEKDKSAVSQAAGNGLFIEWLCFIIFLMIGVFAVKPFFLVQTSNSNIIRYGIEYTKIICIYSFGVVNQVIMERLLISTGKTLCSMASLFTGAVVNMILDPIMIFGLLGNPAMGIAGAAYATVIAQITAAILGTVLNLTVNKEIQFSTESLRPSKKILKDIIKIGVPAIFSNAASSLTVFGINWILISFTETATAAYGIYVRLQGFAMMPIYGLRNTIVSILAYNYGARLTNRIRKTIHICLITSVCITTSVMLIFLLLPNALLQLFSARENMLQIGITALRIIGISIPASGITVMLGSVFQSFGYSQKEFAVSAVRVVLLIVSAWVLSFAGSLNVVWWAFVITEITALVIAVVFWVRINNKLIKSM